MSVFGSTVKSLNDKIIDLLHIDVMDGHFVPNLTFGPAYINNLKNHTKIPLDIHLMIENTEASIDQYIETKPWAITIHYESTKYPARLLSYIKEKNITAGLAINPATPVESIFDMIQYPDMVLIMSVDPGFYGQSFMPMSLKKINKLKEFIVSEKHKDILIQVDGGINKDNIKRVVDAGANVIVAGGSAFKGGDVNNNCADLKASAQE